VHTNADAPADDEIALLRRVLPVLRNWTGERGAMRRVRPDHHCAPKDGQPVAM
jgi:hypothetical protein